MGFCQIWVEFWNSMTQNVGCSSRYETHFRDSWEVISKNEFSFRINQYEKTIWIWRGKYMPYALSQNGWSKLWEAPKAQAAWPFFSSYWFSSHVLSIFYYLEKSVLMNIGGWHGIPQHLCTTVYCSTSPRGGALFLRKVTREGWVYISLFFLRVNGLRTGQ